MNDSRNESSSNSWDAKNLFAGTAWYYARYRPDYPQAMYRRIIEQFSLNDRSIILDLGCGTGQIALKLAPHVAKVYAVDPQEDMLQEGRSRAAAKNIGNIAWILGESGNLDKLASTIGQLDLTVMGKSFHWMDRTQTLHDLYRMTRPGGGVTVVGDTAPRFQPVVPWINVIDETVKWWLGETRKAGTSGTFNQVIRPHQELLKESEFHDYQEKHLHLTRRWSIDRIIGFLYSTSNTSIPVLGDKKDLFETDLRKRLLEINPDGRFTEKVTVNILTVRKI